MKSRITGSNESSQTETSKAVFKLFITFVLFLIFLAAGTVFYATYEKCSCSYGRTRIEGCEDTKQIELPSTEGLDPVMNPVKGGIDKLNIVKDFEKCAATGG